ncbi:MAG: DUF134 domain-containing protein [Anaerovoracaceae bacterium]|jgi:predicted DNA-binding protein (UPF0251 family)
MARPEKSKRICGMPRTSFFFSSGENSDSDQIILSIEEYETIRLIDYSGLTQEQCASQMHVARTTVQRMYTEARRKISKFIVEGCALKICGGNYELCKNSERCCKLISCPRFSGACPGDTNLIDCGKCSKQPSVNA